MFVFFYYWCLDFLLLKVLIFIFFCFNKWFFIVLLVKLNINIVFDIKDVGVIIMIGCEVINLCFVCNIVFYFGDGGCVFKFKNDNELMYKMIFLKLIIIIINIDGKIFGNKCLNKIFKVEILKNCVICIYDWFILVLIIFFVMWV